MLCSLSPFKMAPSAVQLEFLDKEKDAAFAKAMHKDSAKRTGGFSAMLSKDKAAHNASVETYYKFWDKKTRGEETQEEIDVCFDEIYAI